MHTNMHYTPTNAHTPTAFHVQDGPPEHLSNKTQGMVGKVAQDVVCADKM